MRGPTLVKTTAPQVLTPAGAPAERNFAGPVADPAAGPAPTVPAPTVLEPDGFTYVSVPYTARTVRNAGRLLVFVAVLALCELVGLGTTYLAHDRYYVSTDNAQVDADQIEINAPSSGILEGWSASQGTSFRHGQVLGRVTGVGSGPRSSRVIKAPGAGLVGLNAMADRTYVRAGQTLAVGYDPQRVYITARVLDTDIRRVRVGDPAEVRLDAYPNRVLAGVVEQLQASAAGNFTIYPSTDLDPTNVQKIDQYIAVRVRPAATDDVRLYPGLNATVTIWVGR
jgi:multidrug resistance efflux pump